VGKSAITLSKKLRDIGCGVKMSGGGGLKKGSGMLIVAHPKLDTIQETVKTWGYDSYLITVGGI
jgi:hypothetical protein